MNKPYINKGTMQKRFIAWMMYSFMLPYETGVIFQHKEAYLSVPATVFILLLCRMQSVLIGSLIYRRYMYYEVTIDCEYIN